MVRQVCPCGEGADSDSLSSSDPRSSRKKLSKRTNRDPAGSSVMATPCPEAPLGSTKLVDIILALVDRGYRDYTKAPQP